jgi:hypothetical protein
VCVCVCVCVCVGVRVERVSLFLQEAAEDDERTNRVLAAETGKKVGETKVVCV